MGIVPGLAYGLHRGGRGRTTLQLLLTGAAAPAVGHGRGDHRQPAAGFSGTSSPPSCLAMLGVHALIGLGEADHRGRVDLHRPDAAGPAGRAAAPARAAGSWAGWPWPAAGAGRATSLRPSRRAGMGRRAGGLSAPGAGAPYAVLPGLPPCRCWARRACQPSPPGSSALLLVAGLVYLATRTLRREA